MNHPDYYCRACFKPVEVTPDGAVTRTCQHAGETIIAERTCNLYGEGAAHEHTLLQRASNALQTLARAFGAT